MRVLILSPSLAWPRAVVAAALVLTLATSGVGAQKAYRYQDADGNWHFTDRPPADQAIDAVQLPQEGSPPGVDLESVANPPSVRVNNRYHIPIQIALRPEGGSKGTVDRVVGARESVLIPLGDDITPGTRVRHGYVLGDPEARHQPTTPYRVPFAAYARYPVTQGFGGGITHKDAASLHAIDIAMPVGTGIFAARGGVVVETAYTHFDGGVDLARFGPRANLVRILHDDGTYALYAHLDRASVSVRPGDRVRRGQAIAASGNTGFSSGPHLHFAVLRNSGMRVESVPFEFAGLAGESVIPRQGELLTAYP